MKYLAVELQKQMLVKIENNHGTSWCDTEPTLIMINLPEPQNLTCSSQQPDLESSQQTQDTVLNHLDSDGPLFVIH